MAAPTQAIPFQNRCVDFQEVKYDDIPSANGVKKLETFTREGYRIAYEFGRLLTNPSGYSIAKTIQCYLSDKKFDKVKMVFWGFCVLISSPLGALGMGVRFAVCAARNPLEYIAPKKLSVDKESSRVMTWNIAAGPRFQNAANQLEFAATRLDRLAEKLTWMVNRPDFICLQELYDYDSKKHSGFNEALANYHRLHSFNPVGVGFDSGLFIAVKDLPNLKIIKVASWRFDNLKSDDRFSAKGMAALKLEKTETDGTKKIINIFNTHLQASYGDAIYRSIRAEQIKSLVGRIHEWTLDDVNPINILCGDLNYAVVPLEVGDIAHEYALNEALWIKVGLFDRDKNAYGSDKTGTFIDPDPKKTSNSAVDYILSNRLPESMSLNHASGHEILMTDRTYSDHRPIIASYV